jgi:hypothetical protein
MPEQTPESRSLELPDNPNLEWLRKQAKTRLSELRQVNPSAKLAEAHFEIAKRYGFSSWRALKEHLDSLTLEGQIIESARKGHVERLTGLLDEHPEKLHLKVPPYEGRETSRWCANWPMPEGMSLGRATTTPEA